MRSVTILSVVIFCSLALSSGFAQTTLDERLNELEQEISAIRQQSDRLGATTEVTGPRIDEIQAEIKTLRESGGDDDAAADETVAEIRARVEILSDEILEDRIAAVGTEIDQMKQRRAQVGDSSTVGEDAIAELETELNAIQQTARANGVQAISSRLSDLEEKTIPLKMQLDDERIAMLEGQPESLATRAQSEGSAMIGEFGVGMSLTSDLGGASRVDEAAIINGIVRVEEDSDVRARFLFEWHVAMICEHLDWNVEDVPPYQSDLDPEDAGEKSVRKQRPPCRPDRRSSGFFVAVQPGEDVIDAIGLGWMWRFPDKLQLLGNRTLNIGFGLMSDQNVKVLGDGFEENEPPPPGETEIRYRTTDQTGFLFMASIELGNAD